MSNNSNRKTDEEIREDINELECSHIEQALEHLRLCELDVMSYLADFVANICDVNKEQILSDCNTIYVSQARGLFWYAYRYMTNETFEKIAQRTEHINGKRFTEQGVATSVYKMSQLIDQNTLWKKRWTILKRIIKTINTDKKKPTDNTIVIQIPKGMREKFKFEIKEK